MRTRTSVSILAALALTASVGVSAVTVPRGELAAAPKAVTANPVGAEE